MRAWRCSGNNRFTQYKSKFHSKERNYNRALYNFTSNYDKQFNVTWRALDFGGSLKINLYLHTSLTLYYPVNLKRRFVNGTCDKKRTSDIGGVKLYKQIVLITNTGVDDSNYRRLSRPLTLHRGLIKVTSNEISRA